jgi:hypothetical protein
MLVIRGDYVDLCIVFLASQLLKQRETVELLIGWIEGLFRSLEQLERIHESQKDRNHESTQLLKGVVPGALKVFLNPQFDVLKQLNVLVLDDPVNEVVALMKLELQLLPEGHASNQAGNHDNQES